MLAITSVFVTFRPLNASIDDSSSLRSLTRSSSGVESVDSAVPENEDDEGPGLDCVV